MTRTMARITAAPILIGLLAVVRGCKSAPEAAQPLDTSGFAAPVQAESAGLSPNGDGVADAIEFYLLAEQQELLQSWRLEISEAQKGIQRVVGVSRGGTSGGTAARPRESSSSPPTTTAWWSGCGMRWATRR